jgi:hypothetical protein
MIPRHTGDIGGQHNVLGGALGAHGSDGGCRRADEGEAVGLNEGGEGGVLGEETVAEGVRRRREGGERRGEGRGREEPRVVMAFSERR